MIVAGATHTLEMGQTLTKPSEFKILNSAAAFGILSSGLYSDKITAVCREIICNAFDAMKSAGKATQPIEIHLPTSLEPYFSVKDEGTGLPDEDMCELYTTYFASTKGQSNDDIGGFGLGCKSPFAYTSGFTVVSIHGGMERTYSAMLSEQGIPVLTKMDEEETDEPCGITVSMPVKSFDMQEFRNKTARVLEFFPNYKTNLREFKANHTVYSHKGERWAIRGMKGENDFIGHRNPRAIVGNVAYKFDHNLSGITNEQRSVLALPIDLFFNVGDLDVTPSRESLSMTKRTIANLCGRLQEIYDEVIQSLKAEIEAAPSLWFAKLALRERLANGSPFRSLVQQVVKSYFGKYQGFVLNEITTEVDMKGLKALTIKARTWRGDKHTKLVDLKAGNSYGEALIETSDRVVFYMNDTHEMPSRLSKRLLDMYLDEKKEKIQLYILDAPRNSDPAQVSKDFAKLVDALGEPEVLFSSDLPPVPKKPRGPKAPSDTLNYCWVKNSSYSSTARDCWDKAKAEDIDGDGPFFYVPVDHLEVTLPGVDQRKVNAVWNAMKLLKLTIEVDGEDYELGADSQLLALNLKGVERIKNNPMWVSILEVIKTQAPEIPAHFINHLSAKAASVEFDKMPHLMNEYVSGNLKDLRKFIRGTAFHKQSVLVKRIKQLLSRAQRVSKEHEAWEILVNFTAQKVDVKKGLPGHIKPLVAALNIKALHTAYPLLPYLQTGYWVQHEAGFIKNVGEYIASIG